jgi:nitrogen-specific signal transduction histidine kinase/CheY-like chemotaxis protein
VVGRVWSFRDVTERRKAESEREALNDQLAQAQKMDALGTLSGGIAHDFNNILAAILGYSELAQDQFPAEHPVRRDIDEITKAAGKAKQLVRQILTFSRAAEASQKTISLNQAVRDTSAMLERTIPKMIGLALRLDDDLMPVKADAQQMGQIMMNLVSNAVDAIQGTGQIEIRTANVNTGPQVCQICNTTFSGRYVTLSVKDDGEGIAPEIISKIFDPFFTTKDVGKGTGLGLSSVYGIVNSHKGHLVCHSRPGNGTEFCVYLPAAETGNLSVEEQDRYLGQVKHGGETILIVDDESAIRELAARILTGSGYRVHQAAAGEEALAICQEYRGEIDALILDLGMPGMGGKACLSEILQTDPTIKVLVASGYIQYEQSNELKNLGASGMISKPYRKTELLDSLRQILDAA